MLKIAEEKKKECPHAVTTLERDRYADDLIHSCPNTEEAPESMEEVDKVLATGSCVGKEWLCSSNVPSAAKTDTPKSPIVSENETNPNMLVVSLNGEEETKTLRVVLKPRKDVLSFASREIKIEKLKKRSVLSSISKLYDPLGLASAVTIKAKAPCKRFGN
ncbi:Hypothetical predicted protein [Paramuricea clavata]|uniref:Uncharacterized protein n=1 Tax=Paramuricea clavata TaxID=317549 RepID=A0A7D9E7Q2_PARCT|nr:Hypothetical predicted protein [Paramuricea clavata]